MEEIKNIKSVAQGGFAPIILLLIMGGIISSGFFAYNIFYPKLQTSFLKSEISTKPNTSIINEPTQKTEQPNNTAKNDSRETSNLNGQSIKCLGADRKYSYVTQKVCDANRNYWAKILGSFPTDPEEIIQCKGADGKYSNVPRKICEDTNKFWADHPPANISNSSSSSSNSSTTFVGLLDSYNNLYAVHAAKRVLTSYTGPLYALRRDSDNATIDISPTSNGWPDKSTILTWLNGATAFVTTVYDQTGNNRNLTQVTVIKQPSLNLSGTYPVLEFDGGASEFSGMSTLSAFAQNIGAVSVVAVRRNNFTTVNDRQLLFVSTATSTNTRMRMGQSWFTGGNDTIFGRRLDADFNDYSLGIAPNMNWAAQIGRWDWSSATLYHQIGSESETKTSFQTAGLTSNTASSLISIGGTGVRTSTFNGDISLVAWVQAKLSDTEVSSLISSLSDLHIGDALTQFLYWGNNALSGPYTLAPGLTNYTILTPDGTTPTESSLTSHRYHHHTRIATHNGRVWVAFSSAGTNEGASGEMVVAKSSGDDGATWSSPLLVVPAQSTFTEAGPSTPAGSRISYPRSFVKYNGDLYLVSAIDDVLGANNNIGAALVATKCNDDGSMGPLFRISTETYTPQSGFSEIGYDATLGPSLFASTALYGVWGGSTPNNAASSWIGWKSQSGETYVEPTTIDLNESGTSLLRLWRKASVTSSTSTVLWSQRSIDSGTTWTPLIATGIPNNPSATAGIRLSDGRIALVGNPWNMSSVNRDPLYLAIFNGTTGLIEHIYAVRQGLSGIPTYAGTSKGGGAQYPGIAYDGTNLWISYSIAKESIGVTKIPLSGL